MNFFEFVKFALEKFVNMRGRKVFMGLHTLSAAKNRHTSEFFEEGSIIN